MDIHRNNYEVYFLDYLEGRLSEQEIALLLAFLEENPDLEDELYQYENITLIEHDVNLKNKEVMFKSTDDFSSVNEQNFPEFCVAHFEKHLGPKGEQMLKDYLELNPSLIKEYNLYGKVYLEYDPSVRMPGRNQLKHITVAPIRRWLFTAAAAAAILIFALLLFPLNNRTIPLHPQTAIVNKSKHMQTPANTHPGELALTDRNIKAGTVKKYRRNAFTVTKPVDSIQILQVREDGESIRLAALAPVEVHALETGAGNMDLLPARITLQEKQGNNGQVAPEYQPLLDYALAEVRNKVNDKIPDGKENGKLSWWGIAEFGVKGFNQLTGSNLRLEKRTDSDGKEILALGAGKFALTAPLR